MTTHREAFTGKIQNDTLPDLLQGLYASKATGTLTLQHGGQEKSIYIKDGIIVFAASNMEEDRLGNILVKIGKLTPEQVKAALMLKAATRKRFGAIVAELGFMTPKELFEGLKIQVKEIILSLFRWEEGRYQFEPGRLPNEIIPLVLDPIHLVSEMITRLQEESGDGA